MNQLYLFAIGNLCICAAVGFISVCRLNAIGENVLFRVRVEYAVYMGAAAASGFQPLYGEWPQVGSVSISAAMLIGLLCSNRAWAGDKPPSAATGFAPLSE